MPLFSAPGRAPSAAALAVALMIAASAASASGQAVVAGLMGGVDSARLPADVSHRGGLAGLFLEVEEWNHLGIRGEADWVRSAWWEIPNPGFSSVGPPPVEAPVALDYLEVKALLTLKWDTDRLPLLGSRLGTVAFGGAWVGSHVHGSVAGWEPEDPDFGPLVGIGLTLERERIVAQVDARRTRGEVGFWKAGPKRKDAQWVASVGYRIR